MVESAARWYSGSEVLRFPGGSALAASGLGTRGNQIMSAATEPMTLEEFLAFPEDGMDRELIRGILREKPGLPRDRHHGVCAAQLCSELCGWRDAHADLKGEVASRASFRLSRIPDTLVGIDIAYVGAEVADIRKQMDHFEGPPILAVEILSPSDKQEEIDEKISLYLETGVAIVWVVNPDSRP
jgi:Uma2 family endonuclease